MSAEPRVGVSVVIPAYNEEGAIGAVVREVQAVLGQLSCCRASEVIVVSDGSKDLTAEEARAAGARVVELAPNRGYGAALRRGFREARWEIIVMLDGDGTYPPSAIPRLIRGVLEGADQVIGARGASHHRATPLRRLAKRALTGFAAALVGHDIPDLNSGMRALRREFLHAVANFLPAGFSCSTTLTIAGTLGGWQVSWEPIEYYPRRGRSKFRPARDTLRLGLAIARAVVYSHPLKVFLPMAAVVVALGLAFAAYDTFAEHNLTDKTVLFLISGLQLFALGLLADLLVRRGGSR